MSAKPFLITGLPRSRTAWLSLFFCTGESICFHEPIGGIRAISDLETLYQSDFYKHVGISDSGLGFFLDWILENIKPRTLIIERDTAEVADSLAKVGVPRTNFPELLAERLQAFRDHPLVMWVPFDALDTKRIVQKAFWHLMPGVAFDEDRYEQFAKMHIEIDVATTVAEAKKNKENLEHLFKDIRPLIRPKADSYAKLH